jgi:TusA-related sulfurtransferase
MEKTHPPVADATLDLTGLTCPGPILGAKEVVDGLAPGQVLRLVSDCPGTRDDLISWARQTGNEVVAIEPGKDGSSAYFLRKGRSGALVAHAVLDMRGVSCPGPIVEAKQLIKGLKSGEVLKLVSNCPGTAADLADWTAHTGLKLIATVEAGAGNHEFYIGKP